MKGSGFNDQTMLDLFRIEVETHARTLNEGLLLLESASDNGAVLENLMRAAHSVKGAARMVGVDVAVQLAHCMEDLFVAAQSTSGHLDTETVDVLLQGVDLLTRIGATEADEYAALQPEVEQCIAAIEKTTAAPETPARRSPERAESAATGQRKSTSDAGMLELFCSEVDSQLEIICDRLLALERNPEAAAPLEELMRAAHSIKGAARMVDVQPAVELAHAMEECFVAAQHKRIRLGEDDIDLLLRGADELKALRGALPDNPQVKLSGPLLESISALSGSQRAPVESTPRENSKRPQPAAAAQPAAQSQSSRFVRISAERVNRLVGLAGEMTVTSGWVRGYADALLTLKKRQNDLIAVIDRLRSVVDQGTISDLGQSLLNDAQKFAYDCRLQLSNRLADLEDFDRRASNLSSRLNHEVISSRMRPFGDGVQGFPRMVRDVARDLNKKVQLIVRGHDTQVDRDILEKIEAPLNHILRNAIDHGIESPSERKAAGKPEQGTIQLEAYHSAGMLSVVVSDDGRGVDLEALRAKVVARNLVNERMAADLSESELLEFLFLPAFSTRDTVTQISGRGVGLDVVHSVVHEMRGQVRANSAPGQGLRIHLQLPLTLSVIRTLMVEVGGELYAFPLSRIENILRVPGDSVQTLEDRQFVTTSDGRHIGLIYAGQILAHDGATGPNGELPAVVLGGRNRSFGVVVDRFLGEHDLAVHTIDPRLGKIQDVAAAAITDDGTPLLILDVEDMLQSIENLVSGRRLHKLGAAESVEQSQGRRILVVDDSLTVREVERKLLESRGYAVDVAVDGVDGWNTVRLNEYDLVISDVDMPRMNGIELVGMIKNDPKLRSLPVMIVSYKDRQEDRDRGLEAGADYYLAKGSFHDDSLLEAVIDLIGEPE